MRATPIADIQAIVSARRVGFSQGITRPESWRREQLTRLRTLLISRAADFERALATDLGKSGTEAQLTEIGYLVTELDHALARLSRWMRTTRVSVPLALRPATARIIPEPLGVVLVIAPWNYPLMLALSPVIGALAAGNAVVIKPSELSPATSELLARLIPDTLDQRAVAVIEGGVPETTEVLAQRFDHIFYTGSGQVGRIVARAAAEHLTPITLELGGKSPAYVDGSVPLADAARRIAWGKFVNAGQTCVAPDYVIGTPDVLDALVPHLRVAIQHFYGTAPLENPDLGTIVNDRQFARLTGYLGDGEIVVGGETRGADRRMAPTVLARVSHEAPVMQEEIFGPILPLVPVDDLDAAISFVTGRDKPLAAYILSDDRRVRRRWERESSSGGMGINTPILQLTVPDLPFGGVGPSGMGSYHGKRSFDCFSHEKSVLEKPLRPETLAGTIMPPYTREKDTLIRRVMRRVM